MHAVPVIHLYCWSPYQFLPLGVAGQHLGIGSHMAIDVNITLNIYDANPVVIQSDIPIAEWKRFAYPCCNDNHCKNRQPELHCCPYTLSLIQRTILFTKDLDDTDLGIEP